MAARKNPSKGGKPDKLMRDALIIALHREAANANGQMTRRLHHVADALVVAAIGGDVGAAREIFDRVDGKPSQQVDVSMDAGASLVEALRMISKGASA